MPWRNTAPMDQRTQFIADHLRETQTITELCDRYGVSRKTGYKWIDRYLRLGPAGLEERSRRPHRAPNQTADEIVAAILEARQRHPGWGGKKLRVLLQRRHPRWTLPGRSTVCDILRRHGLVPTRRSRRRIGHPGKPTTIIAAPNAVWCADYKGQFKTGDGRYCSPLTVTDGFSRYLLGCQGLGSTAGAEAQPVFTRLFKEYGLPLRIRTDNVLSARGWSGAGTQHSSGGSGSRDWVRQRRTQPTQRSSASEKDPAAHSEHRVRARAGPALTHSTQRRVPAEGPSIIYGVDKTDKPPVWRFTPLTPSGALGRLRRNAARSGMPARRERGLMRNRTVDHRRSRGRRSSGPRTNPR